MQPLVQETSFRPTFKLDWAQADVQEGPAAGRVRVRLDS